MSKKLDFSQVAFNVVQQATGESPKVPAPRKKVLGKATGGAKRMASLSEEERTALAVKAASARWNKNAPAPDGTGARKR